MTTAAVTITVLEQYAVASDQNAVAHLHDASGRRYPLHASTTIGRLSDNDIVLDSPKSAATTPSSSTRETVT